jgi:hypothetical protein
VKLRESRDGCADGCVAPRAKVHSWMNKMEKHNRGAAVFENDVEHLEGYNPGGWIISR